MKDKAIVKLRADILELIQATQCEYECSHDTPAEKSEDQYILECNLSRVFRDNGFSCIEGEWRPDILKEAKFHLIGTGNCGSLKTILLGDLEWGM